ncbi:MAG TPA: protein YgfX [Candidatus Competibacteraceae bacterium]|nr:protein YgfX [Candidatus Competibacteraceae bacterium]
MSSNASAPAFSLELRPSRILLAVLAALHLLALFGLALAAAPLAMRLVLVPLVLVSAVWQGWCYAVPRSPVCVRRLGWMAQQGWWLEYGDGRRQAAQLHAAFVQSWVVVLAFGTGRLRHRGLVIPSDAADADALRRLRAQLQRRSEPWEATQDG